MRSHLADKNVEPVIVFMMDETYGAERAAKYGLQDLHRISDPTQALYRAFALGDMSAAQMFNPIIWWRFIKAGLLARHWVGLPKGDPWQMPGLFLIENGKILRAFRHANVADRPDVCEFIK